MKKHKLRMDDLQVDTFQTESLREQKGTVIGAVWSQPQYASCNGDDTCAASCGTACQSINTCDYFTCPGYVSRWANDAYCVYC